MRLAINLLGRTEIVTAGAPIACKLQNKSLALLAYLATEARAHSREQLSHLFWPDLPKESSRSNLRKTVFKLRQATGRDDFPQGEGEALFLDSKSLRLDLTELISPMDKSVSREQMEFRMGLYRGPFLDGLALEDCPDFEDWLCIKRKICHRHALGLLERLSECHEKNGELEKALRFANRHFELEPLDEEVHRRVMRLLALNGQTGAALAQFELCRRTLQSELNVQPDMQTTTLFHQIKTGQISARRSQAGSPTQPDIPSELRQVTALYCGLEVPGTNDLEETAERLAKAQRHISEIIRKYGGHVAQMHGRAILGYFGYPKAQEDAARCARHSP